MFRFTQVAICKGSVVDNIDHNNPTIVKRSIQGDLQVMLETTTGMVLLKMKDFQYGINPNDQILFDDRDPRFKLMLCLDSNPQNTWVLKVNDKSELLFYIINQRCRVIHTRASRMIIDQLRSQHQNIAQYPQLQDPERLKYTPEKAQSTQSGLVQASKTFAKVLVMAGGLISKGLEYLGSFFSKRVDQSSPINVTPETRVMIQKSVGASKNFLDFSTQKFAGIFRMAVNEAIKLEQKLEQTERGRKWKQDGTIDSAKNNLRVGLEAITNVYDGYSKGYEQATNGLSNGANQVLTKKYGKDAGDTALQLAQGYKNVNKIPNVITDALKMVLKQTANQHIRRN